MLPEPTTRLERSHLRLTFNRSLSEPANSSSSGPSMSVMNNSTTTTGDHERQHQKRLYLQLQHHHQVHLNHHHGGKANSVGSSSVSSCSTSSSICSIDKTEDEFDVDNNPSHCPIGSQSPAKRCCLGLPLQQTVSLPSSPTNSSENSSQLQRAVVAKRTRIYTADCLANKLSSSSHNVVLVDCRPFMAYNASHIRTAINVNCSDRWNRKRLATGRVALADLATTADGKEVLRRVKEVIVYDEAAVDCERLPASSTLYIVLSALLDDHKEPILLAGKSRTHPNGSYTNRS